MTIDATPLEQVHALGAVLGVWAHPDDEAYLSAGLMALAVEGPHPVTCVTATKGEHGTPTPGDCPPEKLAEVREKEMAACMAVLGVTDHRWLGYEDGTCADVPHEEGVARISEIVGEVRPDTIVTFGPDGMTHHPDHIAVGVWATEAARRAPHDVRVLYASTDADLYRTYHEAVDRQPIYDEHGPPTVERDEAAIALVLSPTTLDQKMRALRAQESQTAWLIEDMGENVYRGWFSVESFVEAGP